MAVVEPEEESEVGVEESSSTSSPAACMAEVNWEDFRTMAPRLDMVKMEELVSQLSWLKPQVKVEFEQGMIAIPPVGLSTEIASSVRCRPFSTSLGIRIDTHHRCSKDSTPPPTNSHPYNSHDSESHR